jgi:hypothetical protein
MSLPTPLPPDNRRNLRFRRRKRHPLELPPPPERTRYSPLSAVIITVALVVIAFSVPIGLMLAGPYLRPIIEPYFNSNSFASIILVAVGLIILFLIVRTRQQEEPDEIVKQSIFKPSIFDALRNHFREQEEAQRRAERAERRHEEKINKVVDQIEDGADYKLGPDGELIVIKDRKHQDDEGHK